jgi:hypothetical protein
MVLCPKFQPQDNKLKEGQARSARKQSRDSRQNHQSNENAAKNCANSSNEFNGDQDNIVLEKQLCMFLRIFLILSHKRLNALMQNHNSLKLLIQS